MQHLTGQGMIKIDGGGLLFQAGDTASEFLPFRADGGELTIADVDATLQAIGEARDLVLGCILVEGAP